MAAAAATTNQTKLLKSECHTRRRWRHLAMNKCGFYTRAWTTAFTGMPCASTSFAFTQFQLVLPLRTSPTVHFSPHSSLFAPRVFFSQRNILVLSGLFLSQATARFCVFFSRQYSSEITSHCKHECKKNRSLCVSVPVWGTECKKKRKSYNGKNDISNDNRSVRVCMMKKKTTIAWERESETVRSHSGPVSVNVFWTYFAPKWFHWFSY